MINIFFDVYLFKKATLLEIKRIIKNVLNFLFIFYILGWEMKEKDPFGFSIAVYSLGKRALLSSELLNNV